MEKSAVGLQARHTMCSEDHYTAPAELAKQQRRWYGCMRAHLRSAKQRQLAFLAIQLALPGRQRRHPRLGSRSPDQNALPLRPHTLNLVPDRLQHGILCTHTEQDQRCAHQRCWEA